MQHEIILRICIWDFEDILHDDITSSLGLKPTKIYVKDQPKNPKYPALAKGNGWVFQPSENPHSSFEEQLSLLLGIIDSRRTVFEVYCKKYVCEISCGVFIYPDNNESIPSIHLDSQYHKILGNLEISFDMDIYCLSSSE